MIDDAALLQFDATIIAGILIFLTIRRISNTVAGEIFERKLIMAFTFFALFWLGISVAFLLLTPPYANLEFSTKALVYPKYFALIGVISVLMTVAVILSGLLFPPRRGKTGNEQIKSITFLAKKYIDVCAYLLR